MPNSDNTYGTNHKQTKIVSQTIESPITFTDVATAKSSFFTDDALTVMDECCTQLEWALIDSNKLKFTFAFGTKGGNIAAADDWAGQYNSRKSVLLAIDEDNTTTTRGWLKTGLIAESSDHLF